MCDPVSATVAIVSALSIGTSYAISQQKPKMPPTPELPETAMPSKMSPEANLPQLKLGTDASSKSTLKRERRRRSLSMADLDLSEEMPGNLASGVKGARSF